MKAGIMQAYFFPYIGYFQLIDASDIFLVYENVSFRKKSWITKNRILDKGRNIPVNIQIPVSNKSSYKTIKEIKIKNQEWKKPVLKSIFFNYKKAEFFSEVYPLIEKCILFDSNSLHDYNSYIIKEICGFLKINTSIYSNNSSFLQLEDTLPSLVNKQEEIKSKRIIELCKKLSCNTYINPIGGTDLYDKDYFLDHELNLFFVQTQKHEYPQFNSEYVSNLSIIDVLMHNGREKTQDLIKRYKLI